MTKITLNNVTDLTQPTTAALVINSNNDTIETAFDNTLSRDGTSPNSMRDNIDMDSNRILNLPAPVSLNEPLRLTDANTLNGGGTISGVPTGGTAGQVLAKTSSTDYAMNWVADSTLVVAGTNLVATGTSPVTLSTTSSPTFPGTVTAGTFSGSIAAGTILTNPVINGTVTGTAVDTAATANTLVKRDAAGSAQITSAISGYTTTATAAGTTTLTVSSTYNQYFTGTTTQTIVLPVTSTLVLGQSYRIVNNSTGAITVQSSGLNTINVLPGNGCSCIATCILTSGTGTASWSTASDQELTASGKTLTTSNSLTLAGTDGTVMTFPTTSATVARTDAANTFTGHQTIEGVTSTGATGTGKFVFDGTPTLVTPVLGVATATSINKVALTAPTTSATLTLADTKTLTTTTGATITGSSDSAIFFDNIPQNSQSTAYTLVSGDAQKHILHPTTDNNARTFTIPANASVAYPTGTAITFINMINTVTISINSDTLTLMGAGTTGSRTLAANGIATAIKINSTNWVISGTGLT